MSAPLHQLARAAYAAYGEVTGGLNHQGSPMPGFDELPEQTVRAWENAARAAREGPMPGIPTEVACPFCGGYVRGHQWIGPDTCSVVDVSPEEGE